MASYRRKPYVVEAVQIDEPKEIGTLEGIMQGSPGDFLVTGLVGEQWFVKPHIFEDSYEPVAGGVNQYSSKEECNRLHEIYTQIGYQQVQHLLEGTQTLFHCWIHGVYADCEDNKQGCPMCACRSTQADGYTATDSEVDSMMGMNVPLTIECPNKKFNNPDDPHYTRGRSYPRGYYSHS